MTELIIDNFAGGGGASTGIRMALGRSVDVAINHDPEAIAMHAANHPETEHHCESVWDIDPRTVHPERPIGLLWLSPDCKHFSKAKGGKPVEKKIRGLAWIAVRWAALRKPRVIILENVEEFTTWGPVIIGIDGKVHPDPTRKGKTFTSFVAALRGHGYDVEWRELRACDYGAPTIRKRLFLIARCDGRPICWPEHTHGDPKRDPVKTGKLLPWRTAAECIDWSIPCPSIFDRKRPLADATLRRIAKGIMKYVVNSPEPFIVKYYGEKSATEFRGSDINEPIHTQSTENRFALITPIITECANGSSPRSMHADQPLRTQCAQVKGGHFAVISPTLVQTGYGGREGQSPRAPGLEKPLGTIMAGGAKHAFVSALIAKHYGDQGQRPGSAMDEPISTVTSVDHNSLVTVHIQRNFGESIGHAADVPLGTTTADGAGKSALVTVGEQEYIIVAIGLRMLSPRELFRAQGFPDSYIIGDRPEQGLTLTKTAQVRMCGNSVCPPIASAIVSANIPEMAEEREIA